MKKRGGEAHSARQADSRDPKLATLSQMPSDAASSGGMSDDEGMSNFDTPSANQESKLRSVTTKATTIYSWLLLSRQTGVFVH